MKKRYENILKNEYEEVNEFLKNPSVEEAADILQVLMDFDFDFSFNEIFEEVQIC